MSYSKVINQLVSAAKYIAFKEDLRLITFRCFGNAARGLDACRVSLATIFAVEPDCLPLEKIYLDQEWMDVNRNRKINFASGVQRAIQNADKGQNLEKFLTFLVLHPAAGLVSWGNDGLGGEIDTLRKNIKKRHHHLSDEQVKLETLRYFIHKRKFTDPLIDKLQTETKESTKKDNNTAMSSSINTPSVEVMLKSIPTIKKNLQKVVIAQPDAIETVCDGLLRQLYRSSDNAPASVYLFIGPAATGKTLLATSLAKTLGHGWESISIQMEGLTSPNESFAINGLTRGYTNARPGKVTGFVREHPQSVVVFENFDKAHPNVRSVLEPLFTTGSLVDQCGFFEMDSDGDYNFKKKIADSEVSFKHAIIIFTTNACEDIYDSPGFKKLVATQKNQVESILLSELGALETGSLDHKGTINKISPAFISGLSSGHTVLFNKMDLVSIAQCAEKNISLVITNLEKKITCSILCEQMKLISKALTLSFAPDVTPLTVSDDLVERLFDPLMDHIRDHPKDAAPTTIHIRLTTQGAISLTNILKSFGDADPVEQMFRKSQTLKLSMQAVCYGDSLSLEIGDLSLQKVSHASDFRGAGALRAEIPDVSFNDIAGHHLVKKRMMEIIKLLKNPDAIKTMGVGVPKGLLLWGQPGTGKTMLAKALAHQADLPFIATTGSELLDLDLIKAIFKRARKYAPSILFIDEMDAIGTRGLSGHDVLINQLLIEIDGFDTSLYSPVFIVAATNIPEKIDPALLRSGRIDLKVEVPMLDRDARNYFVEKYMELPNDGSFDRKALLNYTAGMSGADLEMVKRETVLTMVSAGKDVVTMEMLVEQINTMKYGSRSVNQKLVQGLESTAYHEAGHAIVSMVVNPEVMIEQVTVMPREGALGFVSYDLESLQYRQANRREVMDNICVALAGRMAQTRQFPEFGDDSGASSDLRQATAWATYAITLLGLDDKVGNAVLTLEEQLPSLANGGMVFERVQAWLKEAEKQCATVLEQHWKQVDALAQKLIRDEIVTGEELRENF